MTDADRQELAHLASLLALLAENPAVASNDTLLSVVNQIKRRLLVVIENTPQEGSNTLM